VQQFSSEVLIYPLAAVGSTTAVSTVVGMGLASGSGMLYRQCVSGLMLPPMSVVGRSLGRDDFCRRE